MKVLSPLLCSATVRKRRVVDVVRILIFGTLRLLDTLMKRLTASTTINTSFVKRYDRTDRHQNLHTRRKTQGFFEEAGDVIRHGQQR